MKKKYNLLVIAFLGLMACTPSIDLDETRFTKKIIVEGRIEENQSPEVLLSFNASATTVFDSLSFVQHLIRSAKVFVTDGVNREELKGEYLKQYPYFRYKGSQLKGQINTTYKLMIYYKGDTITSTTTIPKSKELKSFAFEKVKGTIYKMVVIFDYVQSEKIFYQFSTQINGQNNNYIPSLKTINYDLLKDGLFRHIVFKGNDRFVEDDLRRFFYKDSVVMLRFSTMDSITAAFWESYTKETSSNLINTVGEGSSIKSNISSPGFGIWGGYNSRYYQKRVQE